MIFSSSSSHLDLLILILRNSSSHLDLLILIFSHLAFLDLSSSLFLSLFGRGWDRRTTTNRNPFARNACRTSKNGGFGDICRCWVQPFRTKRVSDVKKWWFRRHLSVAAVQPFRTKRVSDVKKWWFRRHLSVLSATLSHETRVGRQKMVVSETFVVARCNPFARNACRTSKNGGFGDICGCWVQPFRTKRVSTCFVFRCAGGSVFSRFLTFSLSGWGECGHEFALCAPRNVMLQNCVRQLLPSAFGGIRFPFKILFKK